MGQDGRDRVQPSGAHSSGERGADCTKAQGRTLLFLLHVTASPSFLGPPAWLYSIASGQGITEMRTGGCTAFHVMLRSGLPG